MAVDQSWIADLLTGFRSISLNGVPVNVGQTDSFGNPIIYNILNLISGATVTPNPNNTPPTLDVTITGSGSGISVLTGDVLASGTGSVVATLATVNANTGTWGDATDSAVFTVDSKGRITAASSTPILPNLALATGTLGVTHGGTGLATMTANGVMIGEGTASPNFVGLTSGQLLVGQASGDPAAKTVSGDATLAASGALTLATSGVTAGSYGSSSLVPVITVDAKGRITSVTTAAPAGGITALTGDVTASGTGSVAATLATVNSNVGTFGGGTQLATVTVNAKGLVTAASQATLASGGLPTITLTGAVTGAASGGSIATTLAAAQLPTITLTGDTTGAASGGTIATTTKAITGNAGVVPIAATGNVMTWAATTTAPGWAQTAAASGAGAHMTIAPQAATTSGASGSLIVSIAAPASGTTEGALEIARSGTPLAYLQGLVGNATTFFALYPGGITPTGANYAFAARCDGTQTYFGASSGINFQSAVVNFNSVAGANYFTTTASAAFTAVYSNNVTSAATSHTPLASTSVGSGAAGATMSITAQAGQAATGASNNGGAGGTIAVTGGVGGTSGSAQGGNGGQVTIQAGNGGTGGIVPGAGGSVVINSGTGVVPGNVTIETGGTTAIQATVSQVTLNPQGTLALTATNSAVEFELPVVRWPVGTTAPSVSQVNNTTNSATAQNLTVQAQNATGTTSVGGDLILTSGAGTSTKGKAHVQVGGTDSIVSQATTIGMGTAGTGPQPIAWDWPTITTSDATTHTILGIALPASPAVKLIEVDWIARNSTSVTLHNGGKIMGMFYNSSGTATQVGTTAAVTSFGAGASQIAFAVTGATVNVNVSNSSSNTVEWTCVIRETNSLI